METAPPAQARQAHRVFTYRAGPLKKTKNKKTKKKMDYLHDDVAGYQPARIEGRRHNLHDGPKRRQNRAAHPLNSGWDAAPFCCHQLEHEKTKRGATDKSGRRRVWDCTEE